jgi:hypothetical protein
MVLMQPACRDPQVAHLLCALPRGPFLSSIENCASDCPTRAPNAALRPYTCAKLLAKSIATPAIAH